MSLNSDIANCTIRFSVIPAVLLREFNRETQKIEGAESELYNFIVDHLASIFRCKAEFNIVHSLTEQIESVQNNQTDIVLNLLQEENIQSDSFEFTVPIVYFFLYIFCGKPLSVPSEFVSILDIFDKYVWLSTIATFILTPFLLGPKNRSSYWALFFILYSRTIGQSGSAQLKHLRPVIFHIFYVLPAFILTSSFYSVLLSKLTLPHKPIYAEAINDVFTHPSMLLYVTAKNKLSTSVYPRFLDGSIDDSRVREIYNLNQNSETLDTFTEAIKKLQNGQLCFGLPEMGASIFIDIFDFCQESRKFMYKSKSFFAESPRVLAVNRKSKHDLKSKLKDTVFFLRESGFADNYIKMQIWKSQGCFIPDVVIRDLFTPISIKCVKLPLTILITGLLLYSIILLYQLFRSTVY